MTNAPANEERFLSRSFQGRKLRKRRRSSLTSWQGRPGVSAIIERLEARTLLTTIDLATTMNVSGPALVGQDLTYVVTLANLGTSDATDAIVTDTLPANVVVKSFSASQGSASLSTDGQIVFRAGNLAAGTGTATLTIIVTPTRAATNQTITNTATASSGGNQEDDANPSNDTSSLSRRIRPAADLGVTIAASPSTVLVGQEVTYTIGVTNFGPNQATGATLAVDLTPGVLFNPASSAPGLVFDPANHRVTLALAAIDDATTTTVQVAVQATPASGNTLAATASVTSGGQTDLIQGNNAATTQSSTTDAIDLSVTIADDPDPVFVGQDLTYTIVVRNTGQSPASGVLLTDTLPANVVFRSATTDRGTVGTSTNALVTVNLGNLPSGQAATITIIVRPTTAASGGTIVTNTAHVTHDPSQTDPQPANDTATQQTTVNPLVNLSVAAAALDPTSGIPVSEVLVRGTLRYHIVVANAGPSPATEVVLTDLLPAGVTVVSGSIRTSPTGLSFSVNQSSLVVQVGSLASGASATLDFLVTVDPTGLHAGRQLVSTASVSSVEIDAIPADNSTAPLTVRAYDVGAFQIEFPNYDVDEIVSSGRLDVRVLRVGGTEGPDSGTGTVSVRLASANGTAIAGLNYQAINTVLTFGVGQSEQTVSIPIYDDLVIRRMLVGNQIQLINRLFLLTLSGPTKGAVLREGVNPTSTVTIQEGDSLVVTRADDGNRLLDATDPLGTALPAPGTLRYAILVANNTPNLGGLDTIGFNVPGPLPVSLAPTTDLPTLTEAVRIDGNQQPGFAGTPVVGLTGSGTLGDGLVIAASAGGSIVQGLAITEFAGAGLRVLGSGSLVRGNSIGLDPAGNPVGNAVGVVIQGGSHNTIGGAGTGDRNVISANAGDGLRLDSASNNAILGNLLGTDRFGTILDVAPFAFGNASGVRIIGASDNNRIGAESAAAGNVIANNHGPGIGYLPDPNDSTRFGLGNAVRLNAIDANLGLGIDFGDDPDVPPIPTLNGASSAAGVTSVQGTFTGRAGTSYRIDVYASPRADPSGSGEGRSFIGTILVATGAGGAANFAMSFHVAMAPGAVISVTATAEDVPTTSPFSLVQAVTAGLTVTNTNDAGAGSLRDVIRIANDASTRVTITFAIPSGDPGFLATSGVFVIQVRSELPHLTNPLGIVLDANTQILKTGDTNPLGPEIVIDGTTAATADGLVLESDGNVVAGLVIQNFAGAGVRIAEGSSNNQLLSLFVGMGSDGRSAFGNQGPGIWIQGGSNNTIRGLAGRPTLIGGNGGAGILITDGVNNLIAGTLIGLAADQLAAVPNAGDGVRIEGGAANSVGGPVAGAGNTIAGNRGVGVRLTAATSGNQIAGNTIGTNDAGARTLGNLNGLVIEGGATGNTVGGTPNLISGNHGAGILIRSAATAGNTVTGNLIGTDRSGMKAVANAGPGIRIEGASRNTIGGLASGAGNTISGNTGGFGIELGPLANANAVFGNLVGLAAGGHDPLGNARGGILIDGAQGNTVGSAAADRPNVVSGNLGPGVRITGAATGNVLAGNLIGLTSDGTSALGNAGDGVQVTQASGNTIGGTAPGLGNGIAANAGHGVAFLDATSNLLAGNLIGLTPNGQTSLGNTGDGVSIAGASTGNLIGGTTSAARNLIAGNAGSGLRIQGAGATGNQAIGNLIGLGGNLPLAVGNAGDGITIVNASGNTIGGSLAGAGNTIASNLGAGVNLSGASNRVEANVIGSNQAQGIRVAAADNTILTNRIGHGADGNSGNAGGGIIVQGVSGTTIQGNTVSNNGVAGIVVAGASATGTQIRDNRIGTDRAGTFALGNLGPGISLIGVVGARIADNLVSGNRDEGLVLLQTTGAILTGNWIGTDLAGASRLKNGGVGLRLSETIATIVGGATAGAGNTISGNGGDGLVLEGGSGAWIVGNRIGTNSEGTGLVSGDGDGLLLDGTTGATIGGTAIGAGNLIAGNAVGLRIQNSANLLVQGNLIGLGGPNGKVGLGNTADGIRIVDVPGTSKAPWSGITIAGNTISTNQQAGIVVVGTGQSGLAIRDNAIGTTTDGHSGRGNAGDGIRIVAVRDAMLTGNVVSSNGAVGIHLALTDGAQVIANIVGASRDSQTALGNGGDGLLVEASVGVIVRRNVVATNRGAGVELSGVRGSTIDDNDLSGNTTGILLSNAATGNALTGNRVGSLAKGPGTGSQIDGIRLEGASGNTIGGLTAAARNRIAGNQGRGIFLKAGASRNLIAGNFVGIDPGSVATANAGDGVRIEGGSANTIGGITTEARNVIAANTGSGVALAAGTTGNRVLGNLIGVVASGSRYAPLGNLQAGVVIDAASSNTVRGNLIGGNSGDGVAFFNGSQGNTIAANRIGIDPDDGSSTRGDLGNVGNGVSITNARGNTIGGPNPDDGNRIASNNRGGILILETSPGADPGPGAVNNIVHNNQIGILLGSAALRATATGSESALGNKGDGVAVIDSPRNVIVANTILGNNNGVFINRSHAVGNQVVSNRIGVVNGTNPLGQGRDSQNLGNRSSGVAIIDASQTHVASNIVGANLAAGILVAASADRLSSDTTIAGNIVGTNADLTLGLGNRGPGIELERASGTWVGGNQASAHNLIVGNFSHGVLVAGGSTGTQVVGNTIGVNMPGLGNSLAGVFLTNAPGNTVGGLSASARNTISGNGQGGVLIAASPRVLVAGNTIGRLNDAQGRPVDPRSQPGNSGDGVQVVQTSGPDSTVVVRDNLLAGNTGNGLSISNASGVAAWGNTIALNIGSGVLVTGGASNRIEGNAVGTDLASGTAALGNLGDGVVLFNSQANLVRGNFLSSNRGHGVRIDHSPSPNGQIPEDRSRVQGNFIGIDPRRQAHQIGNALNGLFVNNALGVLLGVDPSQPSAGGGNTIANNLADGIAAIDAPALAIPGNTVFGNTGDGLRLSGRTTTVIGGADPTLRNLISHNGGSGIEVIGRNAVAIIQGNFVGFDPSYHDPAPSNTPTPNNAVGIFLNDTQGVLIGGPTRAEGNVISDNEGAGVQIYGVSGGGNPPDAGNVLQNNLIGLDPTGTHPVGLRGDASEARSGVTVIDSPGNLIGGFTPGTGNVISGNDFAGVSIFGTNAIRNRVVGNTIGGTTTGAILRPVPSTNPLPEDFQDVGVLINSVSANTIGGPEPGAANTIVGNLAGVELVGLDPRSVGDPNFRGNTVQGNLVALNATGLYLNGSAYHQLLANTIVSNASIGISIARATSIENVVQGNLIARTGPLDATTPGMGIGLYIEQALNNTIGLPGRLNRRTPTAGLGNTFVDNGSVDVYLYNGAARNSIRGNSFQGRTSLYGILLYDAPGNINDVPVTGQGPGVNRFPPFGSGPQISNFRIYNSALDTGQPGTGQPRTSTQVAIPTGPDRHFRPGRR